MIRNPIQNGRFKMAVSKWRARQLFRWCLRRPGLDFPHSFDRIVTSIMKWVAFQYSLCRHNAPLKKAESPDGGHGVLGAGRHESAALRKNWRNKRPVSLYQGHGKSFHCLILARSADKEVFTSDRGVLRIGFLASSTRSYPWVRRSGISRETSLRSLLTRFLTTALPSFLLTAIPTRVTGRSVFRW